MVVSLTVNSTGNKRKHLDSPTPSVIQIQTRVTLAQLRSALLCSGHCARLCNFPLWIWMTASDPYPGCHFELQTVKPPRGRQPTRPPPAPLDSPVFKLVTLLPSPFPFTVPSPFLSTSDLRSLLREVKEGRL